MHTYTIANLGNGVHIQKAASVLKDSQVSGSSSEVQKDINTHAHTHTAILNLSPWMGSQPSLSL